MLRKVGILFLLVGAIAATELRGDDEPLSRQKRQIPEPNFPTFGPDVERTADGVPILDESYLERRDRPAARFFAQFEPTAETEGLRLYEGLLGGSSGGRPELRSLDGEDPFANRANELQEGSHSKSWTKKVQSRRTSRKSIQVKSAGSTTNAADLPSGFGPSTGPQFSEEVNYQRTTNANKRRNAQLRSLDSGNNGYSCVTCRRHIDSSELPGATELKTLTKSTTTNANGHETEGLRLYRKLLRNGSGSRRNQLRSLDNGDDHLPRNGILPHHRQSAAWSEKQESHQSSSQNHSIVQVRSGGTPSEHTSGFGPSTGTQFSDETSYRRTNAGRRSQSRNASRTRSLSSSTSQTSADSLNTNGGSTCVRCQTRSSSSLVDESPITYHRSSRVPSTGDYLIPTPAASASSSWAEREERSHHSSRTVSRTINGVETNGLGEPLHSEEQANYRRVASGGNSNGAATRTRSNLRSGARTLSTSESEQSNAHSAASTHSTSDHSSSNTRRAASTLSVAGLNNNGNGRSRRYNCSRISTTSLSEGAQSVTEIVTPPPCLIRRTSSSDNHLNTRASTRSLDLPYPPVQTFGRGDQEVHARVLESDHENDSAFNQLSQQQHHSASELEESENHQESSVQPTQTSYRTGRKHKKAFYRRTVFKNYTTSEFPASVETWLGA